MDSCLNHLGEQNTLYKSILAFLLLLTCGATYAESPTIVPLYTYHNKPPFITKLDEQQGLYFDLADYFNQKQSIYLFETVYLPRKRLDYLIKNQKLDGVVIGVSPTWFDDKSEQKFNWLPSIYNDRDEFVSLKTSPFEFVDSTSFQGKAVAGVSGFYYHGINESVDAEQLLRVDTIGERQVLTLIEKGRADFGIVSRSVFVYMRKHSELKDIYHFSQVPHDAYDRRGFLMKPYKKLATTLFPIMAAMPDDESWLNLIANYE